MGEKTDFKDKKLEEYINALAQTAMARCDAIRLHDECFYGYLRPSSWRRMSRISSETTKRIEKLQSLDGALWRRRRFLGAAHVRILN